MAAGTGAAELSADDESVLEVALNALVSGEFDDLVEVDFDPLTPAPMLPPTMTTIKSVISGCRLTKPLFFGEGGAGAVGVGFSSVRTLD